MEDTLQIAIRQYEGGQFEEAASRLKVLLKSQPFNSDAVYYFGLAAQAMGQVTDAIGLLRTATVISPTEPKFHNALGTALYNAGQTKEALEQWRATLEYAPNNPEANAALAAFYRAVGEVPRAMELLRLSLDANPDQPKIRSELLHLIYHDPEHDEFTLYSEHIEYFRRHAVPLATAIQPFSRDLNPDRPIRVGYVCPDFRAPAIACFILPILKSHRNPNVQIALYSDAPINSHSQPVASPHLSRSIVNLDDRQVAEQIRRDQVDILVDLAVHSPGNRMLVFAQKPASIQITYLPYPGHTGLSTVMYRVTDRLLDPHGSHTDFRIENLVRIPTGYMCYLPPSDIHDSALPALPLRLGCSCQLVQLNSSVLEVWSQILQRIGDARLCIEAPRLADPVIAQHFLDRCQAAGIAPDRIELQSYTDAAASMQWLGTLHIALDPFPFNTMATACDALYAGLPLITMPTAHAPGRFGLSLLTRLGQTDLVAQDKDAYVNIAVELSQDLDRIDVLRTTLRQRLLDSPITNAANYTQNLETAYREMWKRRCAAANAAAGDHDEEPPGGEDSRGAIG
jgi:protein O-GlcNAc transferase